MVFAHGRLSIPCSLVPSPSLLAFPFRIDRDPQRAPPKRRYTPVLCVTSRKGSPTSKKRSWCTNRPSTSPRRSRRPRSASWKGNRSEELLLLLRAPAPFCAQSLRNMGSCGGFCRVSGRVWSSAGMTLTFFSFFLLSSSFFLFWWSATDRKPLCNGNPGIGPRPRTAHASYRDARSPRHRLASPLLVPHSWRVSGGGEGVRGVPQDWCVGDRPRAVTRTFRLKGQAGLVAGALPRLACNDLFNISISLRTAGFARSTSGRPWSGRLS